MAAGMGLEARAVVSRYAWNEVEVWTQFPEPGAVVKGLRCPAFFYEFFFLVAIGEGRRAVWSLDSILGVSFFFFL